MAVIEEQDIWIKGNEGAACDGVFSATHYTPRDRLVRAVKMLGMVWALAVLAVFVPLAHFVLVPALLIAGPVVAYGRYKAGTTANHAAGTCPTCKEDMKLPLQPADHLPMWTYCPKCSAPIQVVAK